MYSMYFLLFYENISLGSFKEKIIITFKAPHHLIFIVCIYDNDEFMSRWRHSTS